MKKSRKLSHEKIPHVIMVYVGGHGATKDEKQMYLLNSDKPSKAMFMLEFKLRYLVSDPFTTARVFGMFDCCRVNIANMPSLSGRGVGAGEEFEEEGESTVCRYFHI